jgi:hypothetical protein
LDAVTNKISLEKALLAIEYRKDAREAFDCLGDIPKDYKIRFLELLESDPQGSVEDILKTVRDEYLKWLNPYDSSKVNNALNEVRMLGEDAENEFNKIIDTLGESVSLEFVTRKINDKFSLDKGDCTDPLGALIKKYGCDTSEQLMSILNINYDSGVYIANGKRSESFVKAAIYVDKNNPPKFRNNNADLSDLLSLEEKVIKSNAHDESILIPESVREKHFGILPKISLTIIVLIVGSIVASVIRGLFGHGQYIVSGIVAVIIVYIWRTSSGKEGS